MVPYEKKKIGPSVLEICTGAHTRRKYLSTFPTREHQNQNGESSKQCRQRGIIIVTINISARFWFGENAQKVAVPVRVYPTEIL